MNLKALKDKERQGVGQEVYNVAEESNIREVTTHGCTELRVLARQHRFLTAQLFTDAARGRQRIDQRLLLPAQTR